MVDCSKATDCSHFVADGIYTGRVRCETEHTKKSKWSLSRAGRVQEARQFLTDSRKRSYFESDSPAVIVFFFSCLVTGYLIYLKFIETNFIVII